MSKIKMDKNFRTKWLKALRSGRYKQASSSLINDYGNKPSYCCLGVAAKVCRVPDSQLKNLACPLSLKTSGNLPEPMQVFVKHNDNTEFTALLMDMNDSGNNSFKKIADYIEKRTVGV